MNILHISESNGFSGGVNQAYQLAKKLKEIGHNNYFACPDNGILYNMASKDGFKVFNFKPNGSFDYKTIIELKYIIESYKFDIVHAHHPKAHNYSFWAKKFSKFKPALIVSRRVSHPIPTNIFAKYRYLSKDVNAYIAVCNNVKKILVDYGVDEKKVYVIYSGVDIDRFKPMPKDIEFKKSLNIKEDEFVISHIGNFSNEKGQIYTIKAAKILYDKGYKFKIIFAGMRTDSNEIKNLFKENNLSLDVGIFLGLRMDIEKILSITDISVNSSIKGEALSGSIRESLAMGVSVVASDISGNLEIVKDNENGFLFKSSNYKELAFKIETLIKDESLRKKFSINAINTIKNGFSIDNMFKNTFELYKKFCRI